MPSSGVQNEKKFRCISSNDCPANDHKRWCKTAEIHSLTIWKDWSPKSVSWGQKQGTSKVRLPPGFLVSCGFGSHWHWLASIYIISWSGVCNLATFSSPVAKFLFASLLFRILAIMCRVHLYSLHSLGCCLSKFPKSRTHRCQGLGWLPMDRGARRPDA